MLRGVSTVPISHSGLLVRSRDGGSYERESRFVQNQPRRWQFACDGLVQLTLRGSSCMNEDHDAKIVESDGSCIGVFVEAIGGYGVFVGQWFEIHILQGWAIPMIKHRCSPRGAP